MMFRRRTALLTELGLACSALGGAACAPPASIQTTQAAELYVGLARARAVAVLNTVTDQVARRISLASLGTEGLPGQISVNPMGNAVVLPLVGASAEVEVISRTADAQPAPASRREAILGMGRPPANEARRAERVRMDGATFQGRGLHSPVAQTLAADARGRGYVLLGDRLGAMPPVIGVVDLTQQKAVRYLQVAQPGETVLALAAHPDGSRLYVALWSQSHRWSGNAWTGSRHGRFVAVDTTDGQVRAQADLPEDTAVIHLALAAPPPGSGADPAAGPAVYTVVASPGPSLDDDDPWTPGQRFMITALDGGRLDTLAVCALDTQPTAFAVRPDGRRAYLLAGPGFSSGWSRDLICMDVPAGAQVRQWPLPGGCLSLALGPSGKLYVADTLGDRLWRVDTATNTMLGAIHLPGAPLALAARPA